MEGENRVLMMSYFMLPRNMLRESASPLVDTCFASDGEEDRWEARVEDLQLRCEKLQGMKTRTIYPMLNVSHWLYIG